MFTRFDSVEVYQTTQFFESHKLQQTIKIQVNGLIIKSSTISSIYFVAAYKFSKH